MNNANKTASKDFTTKRVSFKSLPLLIRWFRIRLLAIISPKTAAAYANKLFLTPRRYKQKDWENEIEKTADRQYFQQYRDVKIRILEWGSGPAVFLLHGWEGRSLQLGNYIQPLTSLGYKVVAIDLPAHGGSTGESSNIVDFKSAIQQIAVNYKDISAIIAHSFGAIASTLAINEGLDVGQLVLFCPPPCPYSIVKRYTRFFKIPKNVSDIMLKTQPQIMQMDWDDISLFSICKNIKFNNVLLVYDTEDNEVDIADAKKLSSLWKGAKLYITTGFGHYKILREESVIRCVVNFLTNKE